MKHKLFNVKSTVDRMALQEQAQRQGYHVDDLWRDAPLDVLKARMYNEEREFVWSERCCVWFPVGTNPEESLEAYKTKARKEHTKRVFQLSFERCNQDGFKAIKLTDYNSQTMAWGLGLGPCGRTVLGLKVQQDRTNGYLTIYQWCDDNPGNPDEFVYPLNRFKALRFYRTETPEVTLAP